MLEVASGEEVNTLSWQQEAIPALSGAFLSPDWKYLAWVARSTVQLMDVETGELGVTLEHEDYVNADVSWSPDGTLLASAAAGTVNGQFSNAIYIWDVNNTNPLNTLVVDNPIVEVAFSTDRVELASLTSNGALQIWTIP
jgi:WD40 repeat protein